MALTELSNAGPGLTDATAWSTDATAATLPPLDTPIAFSRRDTLADPSGSADTHTLLALVHEVMPAATTSSPMTAFVQLITAHTFGDAVAACVRLLKRGAGWAAGYHVEAYHQTAASVPGTDDTTIGVNVELHREAQSGRVLGVNVQATEGALDAAYNVSAAPAGTLETGYATDTDSAGTRALWVQGAWQVGLDLGNAPLRLAAGTPIQLEATGAITLRYNAATMQIEFWNTNVSITQPIAFIPTTIITGRL